MPFVTAPNLVEQTDFNGGWAPDIEETGTEPNVLPDMLNLLPDVGGSDALVTRRGFKRVREELFGASTHYVKHIFAYRNSTSNYLICVVSNDTAAADNVRLYAIDLNDLSVARIDTAGVTWSNPDRPHWGMTIQEVFYGGSPGNNVYSWDGSTWDATANTGTFDTLVDSITPGANEVARDFAFKGDETITYSGDQYTPAKGIRFPKWESDQAYVIGERVSYKTAIGGQTYWRSYRCIANNTGVEPGVTSGWGTSWQRIRLPLPVNADGETSSKWYFVPVAPGSSVAIWHANRFWIRYDGQGDKSRVLYSAPTEPEKGQDVPDVVFDMTDFQPGNDIKGPGGGWIPFNDGAHEGVVEAMWSYGPYLMVFKRQATWVMTGQSEETFNVRRLSRHVGAVSTKSVVELNGLVYFLSDDGLYVTDGTAVEPVEGMHRVRETLVARIDAMHAEGAAGNLREPEVWTWDDMVWFSLPDDDATEEELTWVYDPKRAAFYKLDLPVLAACTARHKGVRKFFFSAPDTYSLRDLVYQYDHVDAVSSGFYNDDTGVDTYAAQDIPWHARSAWLPFGVIPEQRRIRRTWALVKGVMTHTIKTYRDWASTEISTEDRAVTNTVATHIEGEWVPDARSIQLRVSSTKSPAALYGFAVDTQPRRIRYHTGTTN